MKIQDRMCSALFAKKKPANFLIAAQEKIARECYLDLFEIIDYNYNFVENRLLFCFLLNKFRMQVYKS